MIYDKVSICEIMDLSGYSEKSNIQEAYVPKTSISGQNPSKFDLGLNAETQVKYEVTGVE